MATSTYSRRQRQTPWIHRWSRYLIGAIATIGAIGTAYLTVTYFMGASAACPTSGCEQVLSSDYAKIFGVPLTLYGFGAYFGMVVMSLVPTTIKGKVSQDLSQRLEEWSWLLMFMVATGMAVFSGYLMYLLAAKIQAVCLYCVGSAILSLSLLGLTLFGRTWPDMGQLLMIGIMIVMVTLVGTLGVYAKVNNPDATTTAEQTTDVIAKIQNTSGDSEMSLAAHLTSLGVKKYGAWWCPHCHEQQELFGKEAFKQINYVECDAQGKDPQPQVCQAVGVQSYPTWEINGELYAGVQPLNDLADLSGYTGPRDFKN